MVDFWRDTKSWNGPIWLTEYGELFKGYWKDPSTGKCYPSEDMAEMFYRQWVYLKALSANDIDRFAWFWMHDEECVRTDGDCRPKRLECAGTVSEKCPKWPGQSLFDNWDEITCLGKLFRDMAFDEGPSSVSAARVYCSH